MYGLLGDVDKGAFVNTEEWVHFCRFTYEAPHDVPREALLSVKHLVERHRDECQSNVGVAPVGWRWSVPNRRAGRGVGIVRGKAAIVVRQQRAGGRPGSLAFMMSQRHTTWPEKPST
jgi:hypothetical protein